MSKLYMLLLAICFGLSAQAQKAVQQEVVKLQLQGKRFVQTDLFQFVTNEVKTRDLKLDGLKEGTVLSIVPESIRQLQNANEPYIRISIPVSDRSQIHLNLIRHQIFTEDFAVYTSDNPDMPLNFTPGVHYKGVIEGDPNSIVAISVFDNEIMGVISQAQGNFVLGRMPQDREERHVLYLDTDLDAPMSFDCGTVDDGKGYTTEELEYQDHGRDNGDCVRVYIEIDDDIVTQKGGGTPATNYITGLFNQSITLYANDQVNMMISEILAWTTPAPYSGTTSSAMLQSFQANTGAFNGNVGHLVSYQASGGIAVLDQICASNPDWRKCFSSIDASYANVPTYSWSVMVITHEMGHVIASKHTHACAWNGNNTAIDGCAGSTEGGCPNPGIPSGGGTIMSYCHLTGAGINFNNGFGPQPGNAIRNRVNAAGNCLTSCGPPPPPPPPPPPAYCSSAGSNSSYEWINRVQLGSINNTSGNNGGYANYTSQSTTLTTGTSYTITLTPGFAGGTYVEYWRVWIDYNNDLDFADSGEQIGQSSGNNVRTITFTVPSNAGSGSKRIRVSMKYQSYPSYCETFTYGEVEDYTVAIGGGSGPTCSDGIQNQGETGVDCGGPCPPCPPGPTCSDGIQNQGETGIDCGGPCPACPPAPTCSDGIQNQGETGVDCGGPCPACPPGGSNVLLASYFETGWDSWLDGGGDVTRVSSNNSYEGNYSIRIADNSGTQSAMTSPTFNLAGATGVQIEFYFYAYSMEAGEDFWVRYNNGTGWVTVASFIRGTNFNNNQFYVTTVTIPNFLPTVGTFRIQCDASDNNDQVFIDQVTITKLTGSSIPENMVQLDPVNPYTTPKGWQPDVAMENEPTPLVYPNPTQDILYVSFDREITGMRIIGLDGQVREVPQTAIEKKEIDLQNLAPGIYFLYIGSADGWQPVRFSKL